MPIEGPIVWEYVKLSFKRGLPEILLMIGLTLTFFNMNFLNDNLLQWIIFSILMLGFIDIFIKIFMKLYKFIYIEATIVKMEKKWIENNYDSHRNEINGNGHKTEDTTMQDLIAGFGKESLSAIKTTLTQRALTADSRKKRKYIKKQVKVINKKLELLKNQSAGDILADICAEKAVNGKAMIEDGVRILNDVLPHADPEAIHKKEEKKKAAKSS